MRGAVGLLIALAVALLVPWITHGSGTPAPLPRADGDPPLPTGAAAAALLRRYAPVLHYDRREATPASDARRDLPRVLRGEAPRGGGPAVVHGRVVADRAGRTWLQYWLFFAANPQDRGILRTGRHTGDWEMVQVVLDGRRRPAATTYAEHSWAAGCAGWSRDVFVAHGSHASYPTAGEHDRPWPDPDDEARGDGVVVGPRVAVIDPRAAWVSFDGHWGPTRDGIVPGEQASPVGPAFQAGGQWNDPAAFHGHARGCGAGAPRGPAAPIAAGLLLVGAGVLRRRSRRARARTGS